MAYDAPKFRLRVIEKKIERAKIMARKPVDKSGTISAHSIAHPEEVKEFQNTKKYTGLIIRVTKEVKHRQDIAMQRRLKLVGK